jgi:septum formation protein
MRLVLASASPARLSVLRAAGVEPVVLVSGVDEDAVAAAVPDPTPERVVAALAREKADVIAGKAGAEYPDAVVIGCDSMLSLNGRLTGKPHTVDRARAEWHAMAGNTGRLLTGHAVLRLSGGDVAAQASGTESTTVRFGRPDEAELEAYLATGEPLSVAGVFTIDGYGGWFVDGVDGVPSSVLGISLPLVRRLLAEVDVPVSTLW